MDEKAYYDKCFKKAFEDKRREMIEKQARKEAEEIAIEPSKALRILKSVGKTALSVGKTTGNMAVGAIKTMSENIDTEYYTGEKGDEKSGKKESGKA